MIMRNLLPILALGACVALAAPARAEEETLTEAQAEVVKPIKLLIGSIRYSKDDLASGYLAHRRMSELIVGPAWTKFSAEQQKEFADGFAYLLKRLSFPKAREIFEHLDAILYDPPKVEGEKAHVKQTVVIFRNYKKEEIVLEYDLERIDGKWLVVDVIAEGESTLEGLREDQAEPLLKEGGNDLLLKKLREKVDDTKAKEPAEEKKPS